MASLKKKITYENLLYLILLIAPFLDVTSFLFRLIFDEVTISPATVIRPIIPICLLIYIFFKEKSYRLPMIAIGIIYGLYGVIHVLNFNQLLREVSFGDVAHELQYVVNYTYMISLLFIYYYGYKNYKMDKLPKIAFTVLCFYIALIYVSILTNTSSNTYIEGIGYKGWFASGNAIGSILLMLFCISLSYIQKQKNKIFGIVVFILLALFLMILLGTRTGLFGFPLCLIALVVANIFVKIIKKADIKKLKKELLFVITIVLLFGIVFLIGSNSSERRKNLEEMDNSIIDPYTGKASHVTGDILKFVIDIKNGKIDDTFMSTTQQKTIIELYDYANEKELGMTERRRMQITYHLMLLKNQHNFRYLLFGNGYLTNYSELTLEMEIPAIIINFGLVGFTLYLLPFILIALWSVKIFFNYLKKVDIEYIMYLVAAFLAYALSFLAGYTFFNTSSMAIIVFIHILLLKKTKGCIDK